jgi:hypothetical protein
MSIKTNLLATKDVREKLCSLTSAGTLKVKELKFKA